MPVTLPKATFQQDKGVSKLAREAGCSVSSASKKLRDGKTPEQIIAEAKSWRDKQVLKEARSIKGDVTETFYEAQRRKEIALASINELKLATTRGELVPISDVNVWVAGMILRSRDVLLRIAPELRDRLSQETDPIKCQDLLDTEINRALSALSEFTHE